MSGRARVTRDAKLAYRRLLDAMGDGRLDDLAERHDLLLLAAHGSAARDEEDPRDLDLAFLGGPETDLLALREELYDLTGYEDLDLADLGRADAIGRGMILQDAVGLYERHAGFWAEYRATAVTRYAADRWMLDLQLDAMPR